ncbi:MAG: CHAD domain-containing protein [Bacteroidales bacterium]
MKDDNVVNIFKPISFLNLLETDINNLYTFSSETSSDLDKSIHEIRKSLKSISAILSIYKVHFERTQYSSWVAYIKDISKLYASLRDPYIYRKTYYKFEKQLNKKSFALSFELKNHLELRYTLTVKELINKKDILIQGNSSIINMIDTFNKTYIYSDIKSLNNSVLNTFKKSKRLYKKLSLSSSSEDFHKFRTCCKDYYLQQSVLILNELRNPSNHIKSLYKLTEYLGQEHDLQLFRDYLKIHFPELSKLSNPFIKLKIKGLRIKILNLYPNIKYK